jgi:CHASE1-domain containing sensor protein
MVCLGTLLFIEPFSFISFVAPLAGVTTALIIFIGTQFLWIPIVVIIAFSAFLFWYLNVDINAAMIIISILAVILQSYWAKQLTLTKVYQQNWLKSRQNLLVFLFKIGPLTSIVSASSIVVITLLENEILNGNLFYTFMSSWAASVLFSIFFTPLLLLTQKRQQLSSSKRLFIIFSSSLAFIAIGLLFKISQNIQLHSRDDMFVQVKQEVEEAIRKEMTIATDAITSLSALMKTNEEVSLKEFNVFAEQIYQENSVVRALEWAPIIKHELRAQYEEKESPIMEMINTTNLRLAHNRNIYAPVRYVYPILDNRIILGVDVLTNSRNEVPIGKSMVNNTIFASAPIQLIQDEHANLSLLLIKAVRRGFDHDSNEEATTSNNQELLGFVRVVVQFGGFFRKISTINVEGTSLFIEDISSVEPYILFGEQLNSKNRHVEEIYLDIHSRQWRISIYEHQPWQMQEKSWQAWGMLFGTTLGGIIFQLSILMMAAYSTELSAQVMRKTQELIISKDRSDNENIAKTDFLNTLTKELHAPLNAINLFTEQLEHIKRPDQNEIIHNITLAQKSMSQLLDMVITVSKIELGELTIQSKLFDFQGFLTRVDDMLKVKNIPKNRSITMLVDPSVPYFIFSDELRIQQLLITLCESSLALFAQENLRLTVKVRQQQQSNVTVMFIFTEHSQQVETVEAPFDDYISKDIALYSTEMAMIKELCQLMSGGLNLNLTNTGAKILTARINVIQTTNEQQQNYQARDFDNHAK